MKIDKLRYGKETASEEAKKAATFEEVRYSKIEDKKKILVLAALAGLGSACIYENFGFFKVDEKEDAIVTNRITGERSVLEDKGIYWQFPFINEVRLVDERFGTLTLNQVFEDLKAFKAAREKAMNDFQKVHIPLKSDENLESELEKITPFISTNFSESFETPAEVPIRIGPENSPENQIIYEIPLLMEGREPPIQFLADDRMPEEVAGFYTRHFNPYTRQLFERIFISDQYQAGNEYSDEPDVYNTIAHEDIHAQFGLRETTPPRMSELGKSVEIFAQLAAAEVEADMADDYLIHRTALYEELEDWIFDTSYFLSKEEGKLDFWKSKIVEVYPSIDSDKAIDSLEEESGWVDAYSIRPYVKARLSFLEGNEAYQLDTWERVTGQVGHVRHPFLLNDLAEFWSETLATYGK